MSRRASGSCIHLPHLRLRRWMRGFNHAALGSMSAAAPRRWCIAAPLHIGTADQDGQAWVILVRPGDVKVSKVSAFRECSLPPASVVRGGRRMQV
jgi:hypothetical protein